VAGDVELVRYCLEELGHVADEGWCLDLPILDLIEKGGL